MAGLPMRRKYRLKKRHRSRLLSVLASLSLLKEGSVRGWVLAAYLSEATASTLSRSRALEGRGLPSPPNHHQNPITFFLKKKKPADISMTTGGIGGW